MSQTTEWFWVLTLAGDTPSGRTTQHHAGVCSVGAGTTRMSVFTFVTTGEFARWRQETGATGNPTVTFWALDRNDLT
ncbi:MAG TPA: hypothetical protein VIS06_12820 [Mycobacteriales bacterium]|jgi:hypothetical protein